MREEEQARAVRDLTDSTHRQGYLDKVALVPPSSMAVATAGGAHMVFDRGDAACAEVSRPVAGPVALVAAFWMRAGEACGSCAGDWQDLGLTSVALAGSIWLW